jgi:hypothetical protein
MRIWSSQSGPGRVPAFFKAIQGQGGSRDFASEQLQFRGEAFNVFNHAQFDNPSGNLNHPGQNGFGLCDGRKRSAHHADGFEAVVLTS